MVIVEDIADVVDIKEEVIVDRKHVRKHVMYTRRKDAGLLIT
jgi:hypothetical protein